MEIMQAQARICPICFDDHTEKRPCKTEDLLWANEYLQKKNADLKSKNEELMAYNQRSHALLLKADGFIHSTGKGWQVKEWRELTPFIEGR